MNSPLSQQEVDHLAEVREVCQTIGTPGWLRILDQMQKFADEAQEDMIGAVYATAEVKAGLQNRWQQRIAMLRGVNKFVSSCESERDQLLFEASELEKRGVPTEVYAEQD